MAYKENSTKQKTSQVKITEKVRATKFSGGPEYKFLFALESATNRVWRSYFSESLPTDSHHLLEDVRREKKARYKPIHFHGSELNIVCEPGELGSILTIVKSTMELANEKDANHQARLIEEKEKKLQALKLANEEEEKADKQIQTFFAELKI